MSSAGAEGRPGAAPKGDSEAMGTKGGKGSARTGSFPLRGRLPKNGRKGGLKRNPGLSLRTQTLEEGLEETRERARRFETLNLLVRKINSTLSLPDLLQFIADSARELLGVARTNILLTDETSSYLTLVAQSGVGSSGPFPEKTRFRIGKEGLLAKRLPKARPFYVEDVLSDPDLLNRGAYGRHGFRSYLSVPMLVGGRPVGALSCFTQELRRFSRHEVELLSLFADHAALAVQRARLHERVALEARQNELAARVTNAVNSLSDFGELLEAIAEEIKGVVDFDQAILFLRDKATGLLQPISVFPEKGARRGLRPMAVSEEDSCPGWVLRTGRPWIHRDLKGERKFPEDTELLRQGMRSTLTVPLMSHRRRIGTLSLRSLQPSHFMPPQAALLGLVSDPIAIAIERARLYESTLKEHKEIKAIAESARKITSKLDLRSALKGTVQESLAVFGAERCAILLLDEERGGYEVAVSSGLSQAYQEWASRAWKEGPGDLPLHQTLFKGREVIVLDAHKDPVLEPIREIILKEGYRTLAAFPLRARGRHLGMLIFYHDAVHPYTRSDRQLARAFARQAAIAILNAKLYQDLSIQRSRLETLSLLARKIPSTLDPRDVLKAVAEAAGILLDVSLSLIFLAKEGKEELGLRTVWGMSRRRALSLERRLRVGEGVVGWTARTRLPLVIEEVAYDPRLIDPEVARHEGIASCIGFPLLSGGKLLGVLVCYGRESRRFIEEDHRLLQVLGDAAVIAIQNARLYREAKEAGDYLKSLVENAGDGVITMTWGGRITSWNTAAESIYGYRKEEILGRSISRLIPPDRRGELKPLLETVRKGGVVRSYETQRRRKDGALVDVSLTFSCVQDARGRPVGVSVLHKDLSERKRAEEALVEAQGQILRSEKLASIGRLTAGACHEILNPLNIISMQAQLALAFSGLGPALRERFQTILEQVHRVAKITDNLRRFSRKEDFVKSRLQINEVLEEVLSLFFRHEMPLANIHLREELAPGLPLVLGDRDQLSQVFMNLISNARDAMPNGGSLTVSTRLKGRNGRRSVVVSFIDTGCGIPRQNLTQIFDPFFTTKPQDQGTGLGLSVCYGIIEAHGGRIDVESQEGKGSTFRIELPALTEERGLCQKS